MGFLDRKEKTTSSEDSDVSISVGAAEAQQPHETDGVFGAAEKGAPSELALSVSRGGRARGILGCSDGGAVSYLDVAELLAWRIDGQGREERRADPLPRVHQITSVSAGSWLRFCSARLRLDS